MRALWTKSGKDMSCLPFLVSLRVNPPHRTAEKSLLEISELQNMLVNNLTAQSAHIDQLVAESFETTEGVGKGNKELKKSVSRASPARYTFFAATSLCAFLVIWDLLV